MAVTKTKLTAYNKTKTTKNAVSWTFRFLPKPLPWLMALSREVFFQKRVSNNRHETKNIEATGWTASSRPHSWKEKLFLPFCWTKISNDILLHTSHKAAVSKKGTLAIRIGSSGWDEKYIFEKEYMETVYTPVTTRMSAVLPKHAHFCFRVVGERPKIFSKPSVTCIMFHLQDAISEWEISLDDWEWTLSYGVCFPDLPFVSLSHSVFGHTSAHTPNLFFRFLKLSEKIFFWITAAPLSSNFALSIPSKCENDQHVIVQRLSQACKQECFWLFVNTRPLSGSKQHRWGDKVL